MKTDREDSIGRKPRVKAPASRQDMKVVSSEQSQLPDIVRRSQQLAQGRPYQIDGTLRLFRDAASYVLTVDYSKREYVANLMASVWHFQCPLPDKSPIVWKLGGYFADVSIPDSHAEIFLEGGILSVYEYWQLISKEVDNALASANTATLDHRR